MHKVCFVCTGNTCRSPMAAAVYNHLMCADDSHAVSMGLCAFEGMPISQNAVDALISYGIEPDETCDYRTHTAKSCTPDALSECDCIVGISHTHTMELISRYPHLASRIYSMPESISDPYGADLEAYKSCLCRIKDGIKELFNIED